jgi:hypothetical protein
MEAATPLRKPHVRSSGSHVSIDGLVVDDEAAARLVRERQEAGQDPAAVIGDAIEIGARVLDREQAGANADFVKGEFEKVSRQVEREFSDRAREVSDQLEKKVDELFGEEDGHLAKELSRLFSDGSSAAVQNRVKEVVADTMQRSREDLLRQFSSSGERNPLADFKAGAMEAIKAADDRQHKTQRALLGQMAELEKQLQGLRDEKSKLEEVEAERERGTAKGRTFEELVFEGVQELAVAQGDDAEAVGDLSGAGGKTGDVVVEVGAAGGPCLGRVVIEAKSGQRLSKPEAMKQLDRAMEVRDADFAVLVVPSEEKVPAALHPLREYNGDKLIVTFDPDDGAPLALEVGYRLARARLLMSRAEAEGIDSGAVHDTVERALAAMEDVRKVKSQLTGAQNGIEKAKELVDAIASGVRAHLAEIDGLVLPDAEPVAHEPDPQTALDQLD